MNHGITFHVRGLSKEDCARLVRELEERLAFHKTAIGEAAQVTIEVEGHAMLVTKRTKIGGGYVTFNLD